VKDAKYWFPAGKNGHILVADNMFRKSLSKQLVEECKLFYKELFDVGPTMGGFMPNIKNSMDFNYSVGNLEAAGLATERFLTADQEIAAGLARAICKYRDTYPSIWPWPNIHDSGFRLQHYARSYGFYRTHCDSFPWDPPGDVGNRVLGAVIYLNDVEDGGETYFPQHEVGVPPRAGRITLFPTSWTHPHTGLTPLSDDKWMISTFIMCSTDAKPPPVYRENDPTPLKSDNGTIDGDLENGDVNE
jgi:hypothetical protein